MTPASGSSRTRRARAPRPATASVAELEAGLRARQDALPLSEVLALRERAAGWLLSDPRASSRLARAVSAAARRLGANGSVRAVASRMTAEAAVYLGKLDAAAQEYERACTLAESANREEWLAEILVGRIGVLTALGDTDQTPALIERAQGLLRRTKNRAYTAKLFMNLGSAAFHRENFREAHRLYARAARDFPPPKSGPQWWGLQCNRAIAATELGQVEQARRSFDDVIRHGGNEGLDHLVAHAQLDRAFLEAHAGNYRQALADLERAETGFRLLGADELRATTLLASAEFSLDLNLVDEAGRQARAALGLFQAGAKSIDEHLARFVLGRASLRRRDFETAEREFEAAASFFEQRDARPRHAAVLLERSRLEQKRGRPGRASQLAERAARVFRALKLDGPLLRAVCQQIEARSQRGDEEAVQRLLETGQPLLPKVRAADQRRYWALAGRIAAEGGQLAEARRCFDRAHTQLQRELTLIPGVETRAASWGEHLEVHRGRWRAELAKPRPRGRWLAGRIEEAYGATPRDRAGLVADPPSPAVRSARARLGRLLARLETVSAETSLPGGTDPKETALEVRELESTILKEVRRWDSKRTRSRGQTELPAVSTDEAWLELVPLEPDILVLVGRKRGITVQLLLGALPKVREAISRFRHQVDTMATLPPAARPPTEFLRRIFDSFEREFYSLLLAPLRQRLPAQGRLHVVPRGILHAIPFEIMRDPDGPIDSRYLISRRPSRFAAVMPSVRRTTASAPGSRRVVVAAAATGGPTHAVPEAKTVHELFRASGWRSRLSVGLGRRQLLRDLGRTPIVHLAAHAVFRSDNPGFSWLQMGDGPLFATDLMGQRSSAELVTLSACATARLSGKEEHDLMGLAHTFLSCGSGAVVASLWPVDDAATGLYFERFYISYLEHRDVAEARRAAAQAARREGGLPFHWGAFVALQG